jgi:ankyrin repeat protein
MRRFLLSVVIGLPFIGACRPATDRIGPAELYWLLNRASGSGDEIAVEMLLKAGADPDGERDYRAFHQSSYQRGFEPSWPINLAAYGGHAGVVRLLLLAGAKAHAPEDEGQTALTIAAGRGDMDVAQLLLQAGAERTHRGPGPRGCDGTAEEIARCAGHQQIADAIRDFGSK